MPTHSYEDEERHAIQDEPPPELKKLSAREQEVAVLVGNGASNKEIARRLDITDRTVKAHISSIFQKLELRDRSQLAPLMREIKEG